MDSKNRHFFVHSLYLIFSKISLAISGLIFWWLAARLYSVEQTGTAAALISASSLLTFLSVLGISPTFIRFLPEAKEQHKLLGTLLGFSMILLIILFILFFIGINFFLPKVGFLKTSFYPVLFFLLVAAMLIYESLDSVFIAFQNTGLVLFKNITQNYSRLAFLFVFPFLGGLGIYMSNGLTAMIAVAVSYLYFVKKRPHLRINTWRMDYALIPELLPFSLVNFLYSLSLNLPGLIFPLIIVSIFSEREAGLFYIPWMIFYVYCAQIGSINNVFLMKASHGESVKSMIKKVISSSFLLGIVGLIIFTFWGDRILLIFKEDYSRNSYGVLKILFGSIFFYIINMAFITILSIKKETRKICIFSVFLLLSIVIFTIVFIPKFKIEGIAMAWLAANFLGNIFILVVFLLRKLRYD